MVQQKLTLLIWTYCWMDGAAKDTINNNVLYKNRNKLKFLLRNETNKISFSFISQLQLNVYKKIDSSFIYPFLRRQYFVFVKHLHYNIYIFFFYRNKIPQNFNQNTNIQIFSPKFYRGHDLKKESKNVILKISRPTRMHKKKMIPLKPSSPKLIPRTFRQKCISNSIKNVTINIFKDVDLSISNFVNYILYKKLFLPLKI